MNYNLKKPCAKCPFRTDIVPFITFERAEEIADSITSMQKAFPCHKTVDYSDDDEGNETPKSEHCAGALIMLEHMEQPNQMMRISERLGFYDRTKLAMDSPVFEDSYDFIESHDI